MKKIFLALFLTILACNATQQKTSEPIDSGNTGPVSYANTITAAELKDHLYTYASDAFEGRETGKPGQKLAVEYLRSQYQKMGVPAAKANGDYFQEIPLEISNLPTGTIRVLGTSFEMGEAFLTFSPIEGHFNELIYAGYGIEDGDYSDYSGLDVAGKVVLIKAGEPRNDDGTYVLSGGKTRSEWSNMSESVERKSEILQKKGARAVLYYDPANYQRYQRAFDYLSTNESGKMSLKKDDGDMALVLLQENMATSIYPMIAQSSKATTLSTTIDFDVRSNNEAISSENVVAFIKGSKKPNEYLIISSHLDHIGIGANGKINNGADDDGSGTVAMLEIAEAFKQAAKAGQGPERSVVFLHVTGEEKGLLGSEYYADVDPIFPLSETVADLNIDMIGRTDPKRAGSKEYIYLIGSDKLSTELHQLSEKINDTYTHLELDYKYNDENEPNRFYYRSDHYNFAKNGIPIIFYFNGTHDDYHRPSDTPDKIDYDLLEKRARLIFYTAWELANRPQRVIVDKSTR
jgi:hypothetical protein